MNHRAVGNYLIAHRKKSGLTQRDMGRLLGYRDPGQVSRYERSKSIPPLTAAIAYELIFRVPVSQIFVGVRESIEQTIEDRLSQLETELGSRSAGGRDANLTARKLVWINERKSR
jgi:transcriptional regulator with XRE-family HTH domain